MNEQGRRSKTAAVRKKRTKAQIDKAAALALWADIVKAKGHCERCASQTDLQAHHVVYRSQSLLLQAEPDNGLCVCRGCHHWFHSHPNDAQAWFMAQWPGRWESLQLIRHSGAKHSWADAREELAMLARRADG